MRTVCVSVVYFRFVHSWADHVTLEDVYLYLCTERSEVRVTGYVNIVFVVCVVCGMMMMMMMMVIREKVKSGAGS